MKMFRYIIILLLPLLSLNSCTKDEVYNEATREDYITFSAALDVEVRSTSGRRNVSHMTIEEQEWSLQGDVMDSRGRPTNSLNGMNVGMYAFSYKSLQFESATSQIDNQNFRFVDNEKLRPVDIQNAATWKDVEESDSLFVYGYAPIITTNSDQLKIIRDDKTATITYQVPAEPTDQIDIIATDTKSIKSDYKQNIPLTFKHILTGVRFKVGFDCTVKSLRVCNVMSKGDYIIGRTWNTPTEKTNFVLPIESAGRTLTAGAMITDGEEILMMIPQRLSNDAYVEMVYTEDGGADQTIKASLKGLKWELGALVTYTINKLTTKDFIYFDLNAGNVTINYSTYTGYVFQTTTIDDVTTTETKKVTGTHNNKMENNYYVYQSTSTNKSSTGLVDGKMIIPEYDPVMYKGQFWSEYITNNTDVLAVISAWDNEFGAGLGKERADDVEDETTYYEYPPNQKDAAGAVREVGREATKNRIHISGNVGNVNLTIDNIYSSYQQKASKTAGEHIMRTRSKGGISFLPSQTSGNSTLTINILGDNRLGCVNYSNYQDPDKNSLVFQGTGSLTVADVDYFRDSSGLGSNRSCSVIGGKDSNESQDDAYNIAFKSGVIYAGAIGSSCTAIGGGGNGHTNITIEGGSITAVAATTGTAIGGGTGLKYAGGRGNITITGGNVYAYNYKNASNVPSSAIGGAGSRDEAGEEGKVTITGGYVYAYSETGAAIGGGSSNTREGGSAIVTISGGYITALSAMSTCIGGGEGGTQTATDSTMPAYGGSAEVRISGNPTIRTGSVGGGKTQNTDGTIGHADIDIAGGDISAQFVMAGGAGKKSTFDMSDGTISNSDVVSKEFYHASTLGGAVYMEDGVFTMTGGTIRNCIAKNGGAVYIKKSDNALEEPQFKMEGGTIENCVAEQSGGAIYLDQGHVELSGGSIQSNIAQKGNGGGIYIGAGNLDMPVDGEAVVQSNSALQRDDPDNGNGGGIYVTSSSSDVNVHLYSGSIVSNTCSANGGGLCVDMAGSAKRANVIVGNEGSADLTTPNIASNTAVLYGGGLYAIGENAFVTINGGRIMENSVSNYVPNENVANEKGTVVLNNGDVTHVVVTFDINAPDDTSATFVQNEQVKTAMQNIVTATNSYLVQPSYIRRNYYNFENWNTRPDGQGTTYTNGQLMNIKESITLYAQWQSQ